MKLVTIDDTTFKTVKTVKLTNEESLVLALHRIQKELKELPNYCKGCYSVVHSDKGITLNVFKL